ncbi:hypothetical protein WMY93_015443 [Mugilogobius chulae]|uniref:Uncharacterized protein n=1 Tax=Mugilogobius chulae TaxID=88201 RepID=A0AAW0P162_9GOBI
MTESQSVLDQDRVLERSRPRPRPSPGTLESETRPRPLKNGLETGLEAKTGLEYYDTITKLQAFMLLLFLLEFTARLLLRLAESFSFCYQLFARCESVKADLDRAIEPQ